MDTPITFTPANIVTFILSFGVFISSIAGSVGVIARIIVKAKAPETKQNERLDKCEKRLDDHDKKFENHDKYFDNDDKRLKRIEESNRVTQRGMLALLKHSLNGNDISALKEAEHDLESYLIESSK